MARGITRNASLKVKQYTEYPKKWAITKLWKYSI